MITVHADLAVTENKFDVIGQADLVTSTVDQIDELLIDKIQRFLSHNQRPLRVFLSGGVDTLLLYSYVHRLGADYELIWNLHTDLDEFYLANSSDIKKYWGYRQIHHWQMPCVLASGAPGDEFMLRSPVTADMYLKSHGTGIPDLLTTNPDCLHYDYFMLPKHQKVFENTTPARDVQELCNILVNDWQHWHIGNTLTWTLLRDLEVTKLLFRIPLESAVGQILNSDLSKKLIERNIPGATAWISDQKNTGAMRKNLGHRLGIRNDL
jgi:hypothetical protein